MSVSIRQKFRTAVLALSAALFLSTTAAAQTPQAAWRSGTWQYAATIYAFLPRIGGTIGFPVASGGANISVDPDKARCSG